MIVKSLIIFSNMAGCLLPGSGQAGELHASLQSPDGRLSWMLHADNRAAHSLKRETGRFWSPPAWASW